MLKNSHKVSIEKTINNHEIFDYSDFNLSEDKNTVTIKYLLSPNKFYFQFKIPESTITKTTKNTYGREVNYETFVISGTMTPGRLSSIEKFDVNNFENLNERIKVWLKELDIELLDVHTHKKLNQTEEKVEEFFNKINEMTEGIEDTFFTKEEAENLKEKLDSMEKTIIVNLEKAMSNNINLEKEVRNLKKEIEKLKQSTERISKKNWVKKYFNKIGEWAINPEKRKLFLYGIKFIGGATKLMGIDTHINIDKDIINLFPDSVQEVIPDKFGSE